jgi:hypothetical protein
MRADDSMSGRLTADGFAGAGRVSVCHGNNFRFHADLRTEEGNLREIAQVGKRRRALQVKRAFAISPSQMHLSRYVLKGR